MLYRSVRNVKRVSNVIITINITERIHQKIVKRKKQIYSEKFGTPSHDKLEANMRLFNDQVHVRAEVD